MKVLMLDLGFKSVILIVFAKILFQRWVQSTIARSHRFEENSSKFVRKIECNLIFIAQSCVYKRLNVTILEKKRKIVISSPLSKVGTEIISVTISYF